MIRHLLNQINIINLIMIPATIGMIVLRYPLIDVVFKRGAFDETSSKLTAEVLLFYAPGILLTEHFMHYKILKLL